MITNTEKSRRGMPADAPETLEIIKLLSELSQDDSRDTKTDCIEIEKETLSLVAYYYEHGSLPDLDAGLPMRQLAAISISSTTELKLEGSAVTRIHDFNLFEIGGEKHLLQVPGIMTDDALIGEEVIELNPGLSEICGPAGPATPEEARFIIEILKSASDNAVQLAAA